LAKESVRKRFASCIEADCKSPYFGLDKMQSWLGCNVRAQKARAPKKAEAGGGRHCTVTCEISVGFVLLKHILRTDIAGVMLDALYPAGSTSSALNFHSRLALKISAISDLPLPLPKYE